MDNYKKVALIAGSIIVVVTAAVFIFLFLNQEKPIAEAPAVVETNDMEKELTKEGLLDKMAENPESFTVIGKISKINDASIEFSSPDMNDNEKIEIPVTGENELFVRIKEDDSQETGGQIDAMGFKLDDLPLNQKVELEFVFKSDGSYKFSKITIL